MYLERGGGRNRYLDDSQLTTDGKWCVYIHTDNPTLLSVT